MANPHPSCAGNLAWKLSLKRAEFTKGRPGRLVCRSKKRNGEPCGQLAITSHGLQVCGLHGGWGAIASRKRAARIRREKAKQQRSAGQQRSFS